MREPGILYERMLSRYMVRRRGSTEWSQQNRVILSTRKFNKNNTVLDFNKISTKIL